nr:MAG TPA: hypothetical protein [Caudoviricetes sp.]
MKQERFTLAIEVHQLNGGGPEIRGQNLSVLM